MQKSTDSNSKILSDISGGATDLLAQKFCSTGHCITKVGLSDMASYDQEGTNYAEPVFPFKIAFEPAGTLTSRT